MSTPFSRTLRSVEADGFRLGGAALIVGCAALIAWSAWFFGAKVTVWEVSGSARLERTTAVLEAAVQGEVAQVVAAQGDRVAAGDVLVVLDAADLALAVAEQQATEAALEVELHQADAALAAAEAGFAAAEAAASAALEQGRARAREAGSEATRAASEADRAERLFAGGHLSAAERDRAATEADARAAQAAAADAEVDRLRQERERATADGAGSLESLRGERARLAGATEAARAALARTQRRSDLLTVRAPVDGVVGELARLRPGAVVAPGERLATIVADGDVIAVAWFPPAEALGRVRAGQEARMRLDGFPWTSHGSLAARVETVASEPSDGAVRVELSVQPRPGAALPVEHALTGSVEVAIEQASPASLVLRAAGRLGAAAEGG